MPSDETATPNSVDVISKQEVGATLLRMGLPATQIARALNVTEAFVQSINLTTTLTAADQEIATLMRDLATDAYWTAKEILVFGSPSERSAMAKLIVSRTLGLLGLEKNEKLETLRAEFEQIAGMEGAVDAEDELDYDDAELPQAD